PAAIDPDVPNSVPMPRVSVFIRFPNLDAFAAPGMTVQVLNLDGHVILQSENLRDRAVFVDAENVELALRATPSFDTEMGDQIPVRFFYTPLEPAQLQGNVAGAIQITR